jgi:DNA-binding HxlR family transcriptional regulator
MHDANESEAFCPHYRRALELIGRRWSGAILRALLSGVERFSDLAETIPGLSDRMLSERLKELEIEGLVVRTVIPETPVRIEYRLTEKGCALGRDGRRLRLGPPLADRPRRLKLWALR